MRIAAVLYVQAGGISRSYASDGDGGTEMVSFGRNYAVQLVIGGERMSQTYWNSLIAAANMAAKELGVVYEPALREQLTQVDFPVNVTVVTG